MRPIANGTLDRMSSLRHHPDGPPAMHTRPHSASTSNVHFADHVSHRPSISSFLSLSHPAQASSSRSQSPSPAGLESRHSPSPTRRSSQDRRVRSEGVLRPHRPSLIGNKKPSAVTGGYESSSSDSDRPKQLSTSHSFTATRPHGFMEGRRRAQSLMSPFVDDDRPEDVVSPNGYIRPKTRSALPAVRRQRASPVPNGNGSGPPPDALSSRVDAGPSRRPSGRSPQKRPIELPRAPPTISRDLNPSPSSSRKGKERERPRESLASSLGLTDIRDTALSADQLHDLLGDTDIGVALRMMSGAPIPIPPSQPAAPVHHEPYLVSAPPPLIMNEHRDRTVSISSTIPPLRRDPETEHERRRRRSSTVVEPEGGHVPFTHHVARVEEDEEPEPEPEITDTVSTTQMKRSKTRDRLGHLFHKPKKPEPPDPAKSRQVYERDLEIRRIEQERRDAELTQERRFKALTQVAAHPESERLAYRASSHLRAFYTHVYDGIDNPPRLNPLAILRWKAKTDEQHEAKARWQEEQADKAKQPTSFPSVWTENASNTSLPSAGSPRKRSKVRWKYTVEDIEAYKEADGVVNYFIPPRPPHSEASSKPEESIANSKEPARITSPSAISLAASQESSAAALSHTMSRDTRQWKGHRSHQSLSAMNPSSLASALKVPFERLNRKQRTVPEPERDHIQSKARDFYPGIIPRRQEPLSVTDDEHHDFHLRKLFLKGQRMPEIKTEPDKLHEMRALERALQREAAFRQRQAEESRKTQQELEAEERLRKIEQELYEERSRSVLAARKTVDSIQTSIVVLDDAMRHYLAQVDQIQLVTRTSAEVDLEFPSLGRLRSVGPPSTAVHAFGLKPWSRRTALDPSGAMRIDPIRRVELTLEHARARHLDMLRARETATDALHDMIQEVDSRIKQKDEVRDWTKAALERNRHLQDTINQLNREIKGNYRARLNRWKDRQTDWAVRKLVLPLISGFVGIVYLLQWTLSWLLPWRTVRLTAPKAYSWFSSLAVLGAFGAVFAGILYYIGGSTTI